MRTVEETLVGTGREIRETADHRSLPPWKSPRSRRVKRVAMVATAGLALIVAIGVSALWHRSDPLGDVGDSSPPANFGAWKEMAKAPIPPRPHAVSVWLGTEAIFWAGSSLDRGLAYSDGAAYDPTTDTWHDIPVPGWGHPGLTGVFFEGEVYALAKGGGTRFDPSDWIWTDLPQVEGMLLAATVATDDGVWGVGPALANPEGQPDVAIARFDKRGDRWIYGPVFEGVPEIGSLMEDVLFLEQPVLWNGSEIILWDPDGGGLAFAPATETWRLIPLPAPETGTVTASKATVVGSGIVVIAEVVTGGRSGLSLARYLDGTWIWQDLDLPTDDFAAMTVAPASDWVVLFMPDGAPITVHVPSGTWAQHTDGPLAGLQSPNVVWTGERLLVWGGVGVPTESNPTPAEGAIWTPPTG